MPASATLEPMMASDRPTPACVRSTGISRSGHTAGDPNRPDTCSKAASARRKDRRAASVSLRTKASRASISADRPSLAARKRLGPANNKATTVERARAATRAASPKPTLLASRRRRYRRRLRLERRRLGWTSRHPSGRGSGITSGCSSILPSNCAPRCWRHHVLAGRYTVLTVDDARATALRVIT
jgi:hypothetical protein